MRLVFILAIELVNFNYETIFSTIPFMVVAMLTIRHHGKKNSEPPETKNKAANISPYFTHEGVSSILKGSIAGL